MFFPSFISYYMKPVFDISVDLHLMLLEEKVRILTAKLHEIEQKSPQQW